MVHRVVPGAVSNTAPNICANVLRGRPPTDRGVFEDLARLAVEAPQASLRGKIRYRTGESRRTMGHDQAAQLRLWREKRGESEPEDLSGKLVVQLGVATEKQNPRWHQANTGQAAIIGKWLPTEARYLA
jgi:hypothetical protein